MSDDEQDDEDEDEEEKAGSIQQRLYGGGAHPTKKPSKGHTLYDPPKKKSDDLSDVDWDAWKNDVDEDDDQPEEDVTTHTCVICGWVTKIQTPKIKTTSFCQGECSGFTRFVRSDEL
jgi:hypothetical protein